MHVRSFLIVLALVCSACAVSTKSRVVLLNNLQAKELGGPTLNNLDEYGSRLAPTERVYIIVQFDVSLARLANVAEKLSTHCHVELVDWLGLSKPAQEISKQPGIVRICINDEAQVGFVVGSHCFAKAIHAAAYVLSISAYIAPSDDADAAYIDVLDRDRVENVVTYGDLAVLVQACREIGFKRVVVRYLEPLN